MKKLLCGILSIILTLCVFAFPVGADAASIGELFADANLARAVADALDKDASDTASVEELASVTAIGTEEAPVECASLSGMEKLTGLKELYVTGRGIKTAEEVAGLTDLETLSICGASLTRIPPVENLVNLKQIYLDNNLITELELSFSLESVTCLSLCGNLIQDLDCLSTERAKGIRSTAFFLNDNQIDSIEPLGDTDFMGRPSFWMYTQQVFDNRILDPADENVLRLNSCIVGRNGNCLDIKGGDSADQDNDGVSECYIDIAIPDETNGVVSYACEVAENYSPYFLYYDVTARQRWMRGFSKYDVTDDGYADVGDIIAMKNQIMSETADIQHDIDADGTVSVGDILALKDFIMTLNV